MNDKNIFKLKLSSLLVLVAGGAISFGCIGEFKFAPALAAPAPVAPVPAVPQTATLQQIESAYRVGNFQFVLTSLIKPKSADEWVIFARAHNLLGLHLASDAYRNASRLTKNDEKARLYSALALFYQKNYSGALSLFEEAQKKYPNNVEFESWCGLSKFKSGSLEPGLSQMKKAVERAPKSAVCLDNLAGAYVDSFDFANAEIYYSRLVAAQPGLVEPLLKRSDLYAQTSKVDKALKDFDAMLKINPDCQMAFYKRALLYQRKKMYKKVIPDVIRCTQAKDNFPIVSYRSMRAKIDAEEHLQMFAAASEDSKSIKTKMMGINATTWGLRGDILRHSSLLEKSGKYDEAMKVLDPLYQQYPNKTEVMVLRARLLGKSGKFKESLFICNKLIALDSDMPDWYRMRARAHEGLGNKALAKADLDKAKTLGGDIPDLPGMYQDTLRAPASH